MNTEDYSATDLAVLQHLFTAIPEEMGALLGRIAFSSNIKERRDYSCALFNAEGKLLAQAAHIPVHLGAMPRSVAAVLADFPQLQAGDMVMLNDPFRGGSHLPDITLVSPLYLTGDTHPSGYAATRAHHADVGGMTPGSLPDSRSIYQEGLRIPPVRLQRGGQLDEDLLRIFCANSRNPEERKGDLRAQMQAHGLADKRWQALAGRLGKAELAGAGRALLAYAARRMNSLLATLPQGTWSEVEQLEGADEQHAFTNLRATMQVDAEGVLLDFSASDDAVSGSLNAVPAICESAVAYVFLCLLHAGHPGESLPVNAGSFERIVCKTRPGSVLDAGLPHAVAGGNVETSQRIVDLVMGLVAQALPGQIPAQSQGTMNNVTMGGLGFEGNPFSYYETLGGGSGAGKNQAGCSAVQVHMTNTLNTPIEALEYSFPLRMRVYGIRDGSGGAGLKNGGDGLIREWEMLVPVEVTLLTERRQLSPAGREKGEVGLPGSQLRILTDGTAHPLTSKGSWGFQAGERLRIETPGGGGYGEPLA